jgi:chitinase
MVSVHAKRSNPSWPDKILAPYLYTSINNEFDLDKVFIHTQHKHWTLCFVIADKNGNPSWNGHESTEDPFFSTYIKKIKSQGGDVVVSFGGASGTEIALVTKDPIQLAKKYQSVIDKYSLTYIDIDIEGPQIFDKESIKRRSKALKMIKDNNPGLLISYTLATNPTGLEDDVLFTLKSAKNAGLHVDVVNIMAMDYGNVVNGTTKMGEYAISAGEAVNKQLITLKMMNTKIGITPMAGQNDCKEEIFHLENAKELSNWAKKTDYVKVLSFWSMNRDFAGVGGLDISTQVNKNNYDFLRTFQIFSIASKSEGKPKTQKGEQQEHSKSKTEKKCDNKF